MAIQTTKHQMSETLLTALENERRYVAAELHDGVAQTTLQLGLQVGVCQKLLERDEPEKLAQELAHLAEQVQLASDQVRQLITDMRPPLVEAEQDLQEYMQVVIDIHYERGGPPVNYIFRWSGADLAGLQVVTLARMVQEMLLNVRKHAQAERVRLALWEDDEARYLAVANDGREFDLALPAAPPVDQPGAGLVGLKLRAEALGGTIALGQYEGWQAVTVTLPK